MNSGSRKAHTLAEIDQAVKFNEPIDPDHPFYTDFGKVRGDFKEKVVYRILNVKVQDQQFSFDYRLDGADKKLFFLGGMRGSGKTSELAKYAQYLHNPDCFFVITCNIDEELDMNDVEYMDILIFQLEKLTQTLTQKGVKVDDQVIQRLQSWFGQREVEIRKQLTQEGSFEAGLEVGSPPLLSNILKIFGSFKIGIQGSRQRATSIRTSLKNRFPEFANLFNEYIEEVNSSLRANELGQELLFVVDGLEKTMSAEMRKKIIIDESNRLRQIKAYTIFTLPIELMKERPKIQSFSTVESFPFVKIVERNGTPVTKAIQKFKEFVEKRIDPTLFESEAVLEKAIRFGGGSPRELLRILETAGFYADDDKGVLDMDCLDQALRRLANQLAQYLTAEKLAKLKVVHQNNLKGFETPFDPLIQEMLEDIVLMEYNDGTYKRANPLLELSPLYQQHVLQA